MIKIKYDASLIKFISLFESISNAKVKDAFVDNGNIIFVVEEDQIAKAIGKHGINVKRVERVIKRGVKIVEFSKDITGFVRNCVFPIVVGDIKNDNGMLTIYGNDVKTRSMLIGRDRKNLNLLKSTVARYFEFKDIRVA